MTAEKMTLDTLDAKQIEREALDRLFTYLDTFKKFERPLALLLRRKYTPEEMTEAEGKRCVISISGLKFHDLTLFFEVSNLSLKQVNPYEGYDTYLQAPLKTVIVFLQRTLSGDGSAFSDLAGSNEVKIRGSRTYHDILVFSDACEILASNIRRLRATV